MILYVNHSNPEAVLDIRLMHLHTTFYPENLIRRLDIFQGKLWCGEVIVPLSDSRDKFSISCAEAAELEIKIRRFVVRAQR